MSNEIETTDPLFPTNLTSCSGCPEKLFYEGHIDVFQKSRAIAIVGTRTPTEYGKKVAYDFSFFLARKGMVIVSGLARGIDSIVHKAALDAQGITVAVMGSGLNHIYPPENAELYKRIIQKGCVISEYEDDTKPTADSFLARNRIVAGLSNAILIVEGRRRSGTLSTAAHAGNFGREVFAIPGRLDAPFSEAPNYLISEGVRVALSPMDLLV